MLGTSFGLARMKIEASQAKGRKFAMFTSRQGCTSHPPSLLSRLVKAARVVNLAFCHESWTMHESSTLPSVMRREPFTSRQHANDFKSHNFLDLSSFLILRITSSTDVRIEWFKLLWKDNSEYYNFNEDTFLRKCRLDGPKYPWTCCICLNGNSWRWNGAFPSSWV